MWMQLRLPVLTSIAVSVIALYFDGDTFKAPFSPAKTLEYLPYFVIGASCKKYGYDSSLLETAKSPSMKLACIANLLIYAAFALGSPFSMANEVGIFGWVGRSIDILTHDRQAWYGIGRIAFMSSSLVLVYSLFSIMPTRQTYFSTV